MFNQLRHLKQRQQLRWRAARRREFLERTGLQPGARVLDLGGSREAWDGVPIPLEVTVLNTGAALARQGRVPRRVDGGGRPDRAGLPSEIAGDACDLARFSDGSFDAVFSNSVIEHVGPPERVGRFAAEVRRVGRAYWVQTPCWWFPIEAHTGWPGYWLYPRALREAMLQHWERPENRGRWPDPMRDTRRFQLRELRALFPEAELFTERVLGLPKSWCLYRPAPGASRTRPARAS